MELDGIKLIPNEQLFDGVFIQVLMYILHQTTSDCSYKHLEFWTLKIILLLVF